MDAMASLKAVSLNGNIDTLYSLLEDEDCAHIFEQLDEKSLVENPIHIAARNGHAHFALEVIRLKPSFASKLNHQGWSPLHLAVQNGHKAMVLRLVEMNKDLVRIQGKKGMTPLHNAAEQGNHRILTALLCENRESLGDLTIRKQTALHVALENNKIDCADILLSVSWKKLLNLPDQEGNTPLHIATTRNQDQIVKALVDRQVDIKATNMAGLTALDVSEQSGNQVIRVLLEDAGTAASIPNVYSSVSNYLSLDYRLEDTAKAGDTKDLYNLIKEDPYLLDRIDEIPFVDTPLHIAASLGHTQFCMEIMRLKPSFIRKLNQDGFTPSHLALENERTDTVIRLIDANSDLIRVQGKEGKTALHYVVEQGNMGLLEIFLEACPRSIEDVTVQRKTALHIALESHKFDALDFLVAKLLKAVDGNARDQEKEILNKRDDKKETVLHIAARISEPQVVRLLLDAKVEVNAMNSAGLTALDIVQNERQEDNQGARLAIERRLKKAGASNAPGPSEVQMQVNNEESPWNYQLSKRSIVDRFDIYLTRGRRQVSNDLRNILLIVATLIAQATYQFVVSPPGGVWQDNDNSTNNAGNSTVSGAKAMNNGTNIPSDHSAGLVIMNSIKFDFIYILNTIILFIATGCIVFLLPRIFIVSLTLRVILMLYLLDYLYALLVISPPSSFLFSGSLPLFFIILYGLMWITDAHELVARISGQTKPPQRRNDYGRHISSTDRSSKRRIRTAMAVGISVWFFLFFILEKNDLFK